MQSRASSDIKVSTRKTYFCLSLGCLQTLVYLACSPRFSNRFVVLPWCRYCGVCSANRRNQWQARILMHGKVTHLGYFDTEEEAARVYDIVSLSLHREKANTNFPLSDYTSGDYAQRASKLCGLSREDLQRSLGVKPIHKTSRYNGVSKKRGKWVAKVMIDKKLVFHGEFVPLPLNLE